MQTYGTSSFTNLINADDLRAWSIEAGMARKLVVSVLRGEPHRPLLLPAVALIEAGEVVLERRAGKEIGRWRWRTYPDWQAATPSDGDDLIAELDRQYVAAGLTTRAVQPDLLVEKLRQANRRLAVTWQRIGSFLEEPRLAASRDRAGLRDDILDAQNMLRAAACLLGKAIEAG